MSKFVKKSEILSHLWQMNIKPRDSKFLQATEAFLLQKFGLHEHELDDKSLLRVKTEALAFRRKLREFVKVTYKEGRLLSEHEVRKVVFSKALVF